MKVGEWERRREKNCSESSLSVELSRIHEMCKEYERIYVKYHDNRIMWGQSYRWENTNQYSCWLFLPLMLNVECMLMIHKLLVLDWRVLRGEKSAGYLLNRNSDRLTFIKLATTIFFHISLLQSNTLHLLH